MKIAVVGTGYVGLVTGTCFAEMGNSVRCIDIDKAKVEKMKQGTVPIYEPHLEGLFKRNIREGRIDFTTSLPDGIEDAQVIFLALPTPPGVDGSADLSFIVDVAGKLGPLLKKYTIIVDKSTVPVGTAELVTKEIAKHAKVPFDVVSNPEFLREGSAVDDFMAPDRVVVGTTSKRARKIMQELYGPFLRQGSEVVCMDERSAEITKYAANTFIAMKISFMNEIANLCEALGANVDAVREGIGADERIGKRYLQAGIGYGGSCFPKDVKALQHTAKEIGYDFKIINAVSDVNARQKQRLAQKIMAYYNGDIAGKTFALWGLAFKAETDDIREAPALEIVEALVAAGAHIKAYDPEAMANVKKFHGDIANLSLGADQYAVLKNADALIVATEWDMFRTPDLERVKKSLKTPVVFDGRNLYSLDSMEEAGFYYNSIGRRVVHDA